MESISPLEIMILMSGGAMTDLNPLMVSEAPAMQWFYEKSVPAAKGNPPPEAMSGLPPMKLPWAPGAFPSYDIEDPSRPAPRAGGNFWFEEEPDFNWGAWDDPNAAPLNDHSVITKPDFTYKEKKKRQFKGGRDKDREFSF